MTVDTVLAAEDRFLRALVCSDTMLLSTLLTDDFVMIDPIRGAATPKSVFLEALSSGALGFPTLKRTGASVSINGTTAQVKGSAYMQLRMGNETLTISARYIHVFVRSGDDLKVSRAQAASVPGGVK